MKNLIAGLLFVSLAWTATAEPVEPAPTVPQPVVTTTTSTPVTVPAQPSVEEQNKPKAEIVDPEQPKSQPEKEKPRKKKRPLEIKWIDF